MRWFSAERQHVDGGKLIRSFLVLGGLVAVSAASAQQTSFDNWPPGTSPQEVGKLVAEHQNNQHKFEYKSGSRKRRISGTGELSKADTGRMKKLLGL